MYEKEKTKATRKIKVNKRLTDVCACICNIKPVMKLTTDVHFFPSYYNGEFSLTPYSVACP